MDSTELIQELQRHQQAPAYAQSRQMAGNLGTEIVLGLRKEFQDIEALSAEWEVSTRITTKALNILAGLQLVERTGEGEYRIVPRQ